jgi:peptidyl-prolyl cis-trans isomerase C
VRRLVRIFAAGARLPAVHFLAVGAVLAGLNGALHGPAGSASGPLRPPIVITAARVAEIRDDYERTVGVPTADELTALIARAADEEMLYREALVLGLDRGDRAVKWRIVDKMHFLFGDAAGDTEAAYRRGLELGLERDDIVVRNALVTKMRLMAKAASRSEEPDGPELDRELEAYLVAHGDAYRRSDRVSLTQVFVSARTHGDALDADAQALLGRLRRDGVTPDAAAHLGDAFPAGTTFRDASASGLMKIFGESFADAVGRLEPGQWSEPIASPYGLHLVQVSGGRAAELPKLVDVRSRVLRAYRAERRAHYLDRMMDELRAAYPVQVEHAG